MADIVTKVDDFNIKVVKDITTLSHTESVYSYNYLIDQKAHIQDQKDREIALRDTELAEVNDLIAQAQQLGVKAPLVEAVAEEEIIL